MIELMFRMRPYPVPFIPGTNTRHIRKVEIRLASSTLRNSSRVKSTRFFLRLMPALLIRICGFPNRLLTASPNLATSSSRVTSATYNSATAPCAARLSRTASMRARSRATNAICAPASARDFAIASPRPRLPPVITAVRPFKSIFMDSLQRTSFVQAPRVQAVSCAEYNVRLPVQQVGDDAARFIRIQFVMPQDLALVSAENDQVLLIITRDEQVARSCQDARPDRSRRIAQIRICMLPHSNSRERIDGLQHSDLTPDAGAGASITRRIVAIVGKVVNRLPLHRVHICQSSLRTI